MTPFCHSQISPIHFGEGDQHQSYIPFFTLGTSSTSTIPCPILFDNYQQDRKENDRHRLLQHQSELQDQTVGQSEIQGSAWSSYVANQYPFYQFVREGEERVPVKWMSSKMRILRKMMNSDQPTITRKSRRSSNHQHQYHKQPNQGISGGGNSPCGIVRVCSVCNTSKTPLWRSGPQGPKSLCNACGIRQRKARRAMAAVTAASDVDRLMPFKKHCRFAAVETTKRKLCFEDIVISLNKSAACQRVFAQDEKDAAILLMTLSCGLICS